jgi:hypothetical protein
MATIDSVTEAVFTSRFDNQMSAGADAATRSMTNLGNAIEANEERVRRTTRTAQTWVNQADIVTQAENKLAKATRDLETARRALASSPDVSDAQKVRAIEALSDRVRQAEVRVKALRDAQDAGTHSSDAASASLKLQGYQWTNLFAQIQDVGVSLAGGQSPLLVMAQQGPQAVSAVGGVSNAWKLLGQAFTPARLAIGLGVAALGAMAAASIGQEATLASLRGQLRGVSGDYAAMAEEVERSARRIQASGQGIGRNDARSSQVQLRQPAGRAGIGGLDFEQLTKDAADLAVVLRTDLASASADLGNAMRDPAALVEQLASRGFPGMTEQLRVTAAAMATGGEKAAAFELVLGRAMDRARGAAKDVDPLTKSMRDLNASWQGFVDVIGTGLAGAAGGALKDLTALLGVAERLWGIVSQIPGFQAFADVANAGPVEAGIAARRTLGFGQEGATARALGQLGQGVYGPATPDAVAIGRISVPWSVPSDLRSSFAAASAASGVDVDLLARVYGQEGVRNRDGSWRTSSAGAVGPMQMLPGTFDEVASRYGIQGGITSDSANIQASARYLAELIQRFPNDLPRAIAAYNAGPNREGLGSPALGGRYAERVLEGYEGRGLAVQAAKVEVTGGNGSIVLPTVSVEAPVDNTLDKALRLADGKDPPYPPNSTRETQVTGINRALQQISAAQQIPGLDAANLDVLVAGTRRLRGEMEGLRGPHADFVRTQQEAIQSAEQLDPVQRAVNEAVRSYTEQLRRVGETPSAGQLEEVRSNKLRELRAALTGATAEIDRQTASQERIGAAYGRGEQAVARAMAAEKAHEMVRAGGIKNADERKAAEEAVTDALLRQQRVANDNATLAASASSEANLAYLAKERDLISATADVRERELAAYKARKDLESRPGGASEDVIQRAEQLARQTADANRETQQLKNSWSAVENFASQTADTIQNALVSALATGEARTIKFGAIWRSVMAAAASQAAQLALINPVLNATFGGTRATLGGVSTVMSGSGAPAVTDGKGNLVGYVQQGAQAYSAYNKLSGINPTSYINGSSSFATGWGGLDTALNTPIWGASGGINATGAVTNAAGYGSIAQSSIDMAGSATSAGTANSLGYGYGATNGTGLGGVGGLTYGGAAMGAIGIAGGLYGAYAGIQRGGVGGYTSAAGGAATAGLSAAAMAGAAVPVYGWIAAAALMVLGALLPGQKPSDRTGTATFYTNDPTNPLIGGLEGDRYSAETRAQARSIGEQLMKVADNVAKVTSVPNDRVETAYRVQAGARDGLNVFFGTDQLHGEMDEEGVTAVTRAFTQRILMQAAEQTTDANIRSVIQRGGVDDPDTTFANLEWYKTTYKGLTEELDPTKVNSYTRALDELNAKSEETADKAASLGLALEPVTAALAKSMQDLNEARASSFNSTIQNMDLSASALRGGNMLGPQLDAFDAQRLTDWKALTASILDQGFDQVQVEVARRSFDTLRDLQRQSIVDQDATTRATSANSLYDRMRGASLHETTLEEAMWDYNRRALLEFQQAQKDGITDLTLLAQAQAAERLKIEKDYGEQAKAQRASAEQNVAGTLGGITDFIQQLQLGDQSVLSPESKLSLATQRFDALAIRAQNGDFDAVSDFTPVASGLLGTARDYYASGPGYAALQERVLAVAESISNVSPDTLTNSSMERIQQTAAASIVDAIRELKAENQLLRMQMQGMMAMVPAR